MVNFGLQKTPSEIRNVHVLPQPSNNPKASTLLSLFYTLYSEINPGWCTVGLADFLLTQDFLNVAQDSTRFEQMCKQTKMALKDKRSNIFRIFPFLNHKELN